MAIVYRRSGALPGCLHTQRRHNDGLAPAKHGYRSVASHSNGSAARANAASTLTETSTHPSTHRHPHTDTPSLGGASAWSGSAPNPGAHTGGRPERAGRDLRASARPGSG
jgi:hypothetical protein